MRRCWRRRTAVGTAGKGGMSDRCVIIPSMSLPFNKVFPPPEQFVQMPVEEIAGFVLEWLCKVNEAGPQGFNLDDTFLDATFQEYAGKEADRARFRVAEGWSWL